MISYALKGLAGRKLRALLTALAIVLGVAMVSGTFVLTDSIDKAFNSIFTDVRKGSNVIVSGKPAFTLSDQNGTTAPPLEPQSSETRSATPIRSSSRKSGACANSLRPPDPSASTVLVSGSSTSARSSR